MKIENETIKKLLLSRPETNSKQNSIVLHLTFIFSLDFWFLYPMLSAQYSVPNAQYPMPTIEQDNAIICYYALWIHNLCMFKILRQNTKDRQIKTIFRNANKFLDTFYRCTTYNVPMLFGYM